MTAALCVALALFAGGLLIYHIRTRKIMNALNEMLDEAIRGEFEATKYDETVLSKIESKLSRFLALGKLKKGQLMHEQEKIRSLIGDISHQTKTPVANVLLYTQLLCEHEALPEDAKALAAQIASGANKLRFLIEALIKTSRLESGVIQLTPRRGDVSELIQAAMEDCAPKAKEKRVTLAVAPTPEPLPAMLDLKWCAEALYNILDNAVKYTDDNGVVDISAASYEMFVRIDIKDSGRGIREEDIPRVFGRFWRAKESAEDDGVGIGLYLAREIISACGGYIKASSVDGKGSVFSLFLPKG